MAEFLGRSDAEPGTSVEQSEQGVYNVDMGGECVRDEVPMSRYPCPYCHQAVEYLGEMSASCLACRKALMGHPPTGLGIARWLPGEFGGCKLLEVADPRSGGHVFKAEDSARKGLAAVRILPEYPELPAETQAEVDRILGVLPAMTHPSLVSVRAQGTQTGVRFLVREWVDGTPLNDAFRGERGADRTLTFERVLPIYQQLVGALAALHERRIAHGRVRPERVLITGEGTVKLLEPELVPASGERDVHLAPERRNSSLPTGRSDVYELGMVLYEQLTGFLPGTVPRRPSIVNPTVPEWFDRLILGMLERDPRARTLDLPDGPTIHGVSEATVNRLAGALGGALLGGAIGAVTAYWMEARIWVGGLCGLVPGILAGFFIQPSQTPDVATHPRPIQPVSPVRPDPNSVGQSFGITTRGEGFKPRGERGDDRSTIRGE